MQNSNNNANQDEQEGRPIQPTSFKTMPLFSNNLFAKGLSELSSTPQREPAILDPQSLQAQPSTLLIGGLNKTQVMKDPTKIESGQGGGNETVDAKDLSKQASGLPQATNFIPISMISPFGNAGNQGLFSKPIFAPKGLGSLLKTAETKNPQDKKGTSSSSQLTNFQQQSQSLIDDPKVQQSNATKEESKNVVDAGLSTLESPSVGQESSKSQQLLKENPRVFDSLPPGLVGKPFASLSSVQGTVSGPGLFGFPTNNNLFQSLSSQISSNTGGIFSTGQPALGGEVVTGTNYQYLSLDLIAPTVSQDLDLSVDRVDGSKAKLFVLNQGQSKVAPLSSDSDDVSCSRRSVLVFLSQKGTNLSVLLDQQELSENVIGEAVQKEFQIGEILDFTLVERQKPDYLYLVCLVKPAKLLIFDCKNLMQNVFGNADLHENQIRYVNNIEVNDQEVNKIYSVDGNSLLKSSSIQEDEGQIITASTTKLTLITFGQFDTETQMVLEAPDNEVGSAIQDLFWRNNQVFVCYQQKQKGSTIVVYEIDSLQVIFRALYADCDKVQNLIYMAPQDMRNDQQSLSGYLILSELKSKKCLKKLHIVQINQRIKNKKRVDKLEQIDALTFSDERAKLLTTVHYKKTLFLFMINRERMNKSATALNQSAKVRIFTVKIGYKQLNDDGQPQLAFHFVSEVMGQIDPNYLHERQSSLRSINHQSPNKQSQMAEKSKPSYICAYFSPKIKRVYLYVGVGQSCAVFSRTLDEIGGSATNGFDIADDAVIKNKYTTDEVDELLKKIDEDKIKDQMELDAQLNEQVRQKWEEIESAPSSLSNRQSDNDMLDPAIQSSTKKSKVKQSVAPLAQPKKKDHSNKKPQQAAPSTVQEINKLPVVQQQSQSQQQAQTTQQTPKQSAPAKSSTAAPSQNTVVKKAIPTARKGQQDLLIENYQELNKKYADLHIKLNQLNQQVQSQKDIQVQVEQTITKAIRTALPELVKKQVEETLPPILQQQADMLDRQVRQVLIPRLESIFSEPSSESNIQNIKRIVQSEFHEALQNEILPELEKSIKGMLTQVRDNLARVDDVLYKKLVHEETRSDQMVQLLEQKLQQYQFYLQQQNQRQQTQSQQFQLQPQFQQQMPLTTFQPMPIQQQSIHPSHILTPPHQYQLVPQTTLQQKPHQLERQSSLQIQQQPFTPSQQQSFTHHQSYQPVVSTQFTPSPQQPQLNNQNSYGQQRYEQQPFQFTDIQQNQVYQQQPLMQTSYIQKIESIPEFNPQFINLQQQQQQQYLNQSMQQQVQNQAQPRIQIQSPVNMSMSQHSSVPQQQRQSAASVQMMSHIINEPKSYLLDQRQESTNDLQRIISDLE